MGDVIVQAWKWVVSERNWLFDGIGAAILVGIVGWLLSRLIGAKKSQAEQIQRGGNNSTNYQARGDINVNSERSRSGKKSDW